MNLRNTGKEFWSIHDRFFQLNKEEKLARIDLDFHAPSEIFSPTVQAAIPIMSEDFLAQLFNTFDFVPDSYKLDIRIFFSDLEGYSEERLEEIFRKNMMLTLRILGQKTRRRNRLVLILCAIGLVFILLTTWLNRLWTDEGTVRNIVFFLLDIVATVPFWGAMDIYLVKGGKRRKTAANIRKRFNSISFHRKNNLNDSPSCD